MLFERLAHNVLAEAGIHCAGCEVRMVQDLADQVKIVAGLGEPTSDRPAEVVKANILYPSCFANSEPRLANVHEMLTLPCAWQNVRIVLLVR